MQLLLELLELLQEPSVQSIIGAAHLQEARQAHQRPAATHYRQFQSLATPKHRLAEKRALLLPGSYRA